MSSTTTDARWFVRALAHRVRMLGVGEFAILWVDIPLQSGGAGPFVRVTHLGGATAIEVSTNRFLDDSCRLSDDDEFRLLELGFHPPIGDWPDFWLVSTPADAGRTSCRVAAVLTEVLGVTDARSISYDGGTVRDTTRSRLLAAPASLLHHAGTLTVWADYDAAGDLEITGHDLGRPAVAGEQEYVITVPAAAFPLIRTSFRAPADVDLRALLTAYGPVLMRSGEQRWFDDHDVGYELHSHVQR